MGATQSTFDINSRIRDPIGRMNATLSKRINTNQIDVLPFVNSPTWLDYLIPFLLGPSLISSMEVCPQWFVIITEWIKTKCHTLNDQFDRAYGGLLSIDASTIKFEPVYIAEKSLRMDWIIYAKVHPNCVNRITQIGHSFSYVEGTIHNFRSSRVRSNLQKSGLNGVLDLGSTIAHPPKATSSPASLTSRRSANGSLKTAGSSGKNKHNQSTSSASIVAPLNSSYEGGRGAPRGYQVNFQFDTFKAGTSRTLWIQKDMCRFHGDETKIATTCSVGCVCVDDRIEIAVNLLNAFGLVDWESIRWTPAKQANISHSTLLSRNCPLSTEYKDWFDMERFQSMTTERLRKSESFHPHLQHVDTSFAGVDIAVRRTEYISSTQGNVGEGAERVWGMPVEVLPPESPIICPLMRLGLQHDRGLFMQLRSGDRLVSFLCQGGANPS